MSTQWAHTTERPIAILEVMADFELKHGALVLSAEQKDKLARPTPDQLVRSFRECLQEAARKRFACRQASWFEGMRAPALTHVGFCSL
eukprot:3436160-Alexandrium_andersonii.AAC.1